MSTATSRTSETLSHSAHAAARKETKLHERGSDNDRTFHSTPENTGSDRTAWDFLADIGCQQMAVLTESTSALYRGSENMRKIQQATAHQASVRHAEAAQKLFGHCPPSDVLPLRSELLRADLQSAGQYWQQLAVAAMQTQRELIISMSRLLDTEKGAGVTSALDAFQATLPALATSFFVTRTDRQYEQPHDA